MRQNRKERAGGKNPQVSLLWIGARQRLQFCHRRTEIGFGKNTAGTAGIHACGARASTGIGNNSSKFDRRSRMLLAIARGVVHLN
jgi:hypothetical protein